MFNLLPTGMSCCLTSAIVVDPFPPQHAAARSVDKSVLRPWGLLHLGSRFLVVRRFRVRAALSTRSFNLPWPRRGFRT